MKKKQKQQQTKKFDSKEIKQVNYSDEDYKVIRSFFIVLAIVLVLLASLFFLNGKYVTKDQFQDDVPTTTKAVNYDESVILVDQMFSIKDDEYMVLLYDTTDNTNNLLYNKLANSYTGKTPFYSVDLSNAMNKKYYDKSKEDNQNPTKPSEVMVKGPRLFVIKKGQVTSFISDEAEIVKLLSVKPEK